MKIILISIWITGCLGIKAQSHRFIYDVQYRKDSTQNLMTKENYHLDIDQKEVKYYPRDFYVGDSLITNNIPFGKDMQFNTSGIISHQQGSSTYNDYDVLESVVLKRVANAAQNWKLTGEKKQIKELSVQKAVTSWGGRNWIAWFSPEIPFQEGPYKFHGLPGLIVELYDDKNDYHFELVKNQKLSKPYVNQFIQYMESRSVMVNDEKYKEAKLKYYASPVNYLRNSAGVTRSNEEYYLNDGTLVGENNSREINERLRESIRKYNNPIEIDTAIRYPSEL
ncbi:GLPGLI family protein [Chryseobacterium taichungense]|uniref:GLPGLI family protein n=1 Tax=Chryseobacterium taichungense TaxID=295069 RepID=A0A1H8C3Y1_9FLAO|nr:GLPGLI family protein [Chryseobacterium taichungense]SEM89756.1 GLPGLI family protein [Chryseobacterium taichungense]